MYFGHILSPTPTNFRSYHALSTQIRVLFLYLEKKGKQTKKTKNNKTKTHTKIMECIFVLASTPEHGTCSFYSTGENWFSFSQKAPMANSFLVSGRSLNSLPRLCPEIFLRLGFAHISRMLSWFAGAHLGISFAVPGRCSSFGVTTVPGSCKVFTSFT